MVKFTPFSFFLRVCGRDSVIPAALDTFNIQYQYLDNDEDQELGDAEDENCEDNEITE